MEDTISNGFSFDLPKNRSNVIKVIGVGGGGSNAINYMFEQGIKGVDFVVSNTDAQALSESPVPIKIQLGASLTEGLGAGANPDIGARSAQESHDAINALLTTQTKMIFITAGMGGGTGTGAAPIIANMAKSLDILTVGIVTMPFQFEGKIRLEQAQKGLECLKQNVDALIVINNNKLREVYGNLGFKAGFAKADEVLATAARGIAEVITNHYTQNIDLKDAKTVLTNSGTAIMGSATASGTNRSQDAITNALDSPLLNDNKISGCKNVLLLIVSGTEEITIDEIGEINDFIQTEAGNSTNIIMGVGEDESLGNAVSVTIIATGFGVDQQDDIVNTEAKKIIHTLEDEQLMQHDLSDSTPNRNTVPNSEQNIYEKQSSNTIIRHQLEEADESPSMHKPEELDPLIEMNDAIMNLEVVYEILAYEKEDIIQPSNASILSNEVLKNEVLENEELNEAVKNEEAEKNQEFIINEISPNIADIQVHDYEVVSGEEQQFEFDFQLPTEKPLEQINFETPAAEIEDVVKDTAAVEVTFETPTVRFELKDTQEETVSNSNTEPFMLDDIEVKTKQDSTPISAVEGETKAADVNPFDHSISHMKSNNEKRKAHLKEFNHKFKHQAHRVDEMEKEPAYKRVGMDLDDTGLPENQNSRLSLNNDSNEDLQLRSNNSFLHDNVD